MRKFIPLLWITPLIFIFDQVSKLWIIAKIPVGGRITAIPGYFELVHLKNRGAAFGMLSGWNSDLREWFFYGISIFALIALIVLYRQSHSEQRKVQAPLALILGGALGNLADRFRHGEVTDFLLFHWKDKVADFTILGKNFHFVLSWPAFNIADTAITCGALYLIATMLLGRPSLTHKQEDSRAERNIT